MNFCPNCGTRFETPNQPVCSHCGYQMPAMPGTAQPMAAAPEAPPPAPAPQADLFGGAAAAGEAPAPLFEAAVGPAESGVSPSAPQAGPGALFGGAEPEAPVAPAFPVPQPAAAGEQSMPEARGEDLLELLQEVQNETDPTPRAPASILPETPAEAPPKAPAPAVFAENTGEIPAPAAQPGSTAVTFELPPENPAAPAGQAQPNLFGEAAPAESAQPGLFGEAAAPAPAPAAEPDLFAGADALDGTPDLFAEAEVMEPKAAPGFFAEAQAAPQAAPPKAPAPAPAAAPRQPVQQAYQPPAQGGLFDNADESAWQRPAEARPQPRQGSPARPPAGEPRQPARAREADPRRAGRSAPAAESAYTYDEEIARRAAEEARRGGPPPDEGFAAGAIRTKKQAPPVRLPEPEPVRHRSVGGTIVTWVFLVILFAALVGGATLVMLYFQNRPAKAIDAFTEAIAAQDKDAITNLVKLDGISPNDEGWAAFFAAFEKQSNLNTLKAQMLQQADDPEGNPELTYPAVTIAGRPFLLFIEKYTITLHGVDLLAPGAETGSTVRLGSTDFAGVSTAEGELYTALMPGLYQCRVAAPGVDPGTVTAVEVLAFEVPGPNRIGGAAAATANLTIENVLGDVSAVYVNELPVDSRPEGGVLSLPGVSLGSTIRIETTHEEKPQQASVTFSDMAVTTLRFENYSERGGSTGGGDSSAAEPDEPSEALKAAQALTAQDINAVMATFYASYLDAINEQSVDKIKLATDSGKTAFAQRISTDLNKANTFEYDSVAADGATIKPSDDNGTPTVTVECAFKYRYKAREGDDPQWEEGANRQKVTLVRVDGQWLVTAMERL